MDYGYGGLLATIRNIRERNIVYAGTGANLYEASKPAYPFKHHLSKNANNVATRRFATKT